MTSSDSSFGSGNGLGMSWRWERVGTDAAEGVPAWMRVGPDHEGALHAVVLFLARSRQAEGPVWGARPLEEVQKEALTDRGADAQTVLEELEGLDVVERVSAITWRATDMAVEAIEEAYAERDPMSEA